jgi:hypothetical protein
MPGRRWQLPPLPDHPQRKVVDTALDGSYRRLRFTSTDLCATLSTFFDSVRPFMLDTTNLFTNERFDLKICPFLILLMKHLVGGEEKEEKIFLSIKATPLNEEFVNSMDGEFTTRLEAFTQRGSGFSLKNVISLEWDVVQYHQIPFLTGHGQVTLPHALYTKKAVVNVEAPYDQCFK